MRTSFLRSMLEQGRPLRSGALPMIRHLLLPVAILAVGCNRTPVKPATVSPTNGPEPTVANRSMTNVHSLPTTDESWLSLLGAVDLARGRGNWSRVDGGLRVAAAEGATIVLPAAPKGDYDLRVAFTRRTGQNSIAIFFPYGSGRAAFEVDAWGENLAGIQNVNGQDLRSNPTRRPNVRLENGTRYTLALEVRAGEIRGYLDDQMIAALKTDGGDLRISDIWRFPANAMLGLGAWASETDFHAIEIREPGGPIVSVTASAAPAPKPPTPPLPPEASPPTARSRPVIRPDADGRPTTAPRVLIVVANQDFFYREYGDPRDELEKAGFRVTVAAGTKGLCRPHGGSGQGSEGGMIQADLALADVNASDYQAVLFSGGWGSSMYQFAFTGRYDNASYNGTAAIKRDANRVIGDFLKQDKYVCALCNGVTVLAWARVDGQSPLKGKRVCAPTRQAAAGIYNGQRAQPSCRWHPEQNGARLVPAGSIGQPNTAADDVVVDGKIVTGEDDISARDMGRTIVRLLSR